jgi:hypothetical protein
LITDDRTAEEVLKLDEQLTEAKEGLKAANA